MTEGYGWAVVVDGEIAINTVSVTERAAKVNAVIVLAKMYVMDNWTDDKINRMFDQFVRTFDWRLIRVKIIEEIRN